MILTPEQQTITVDILRGKFPDVPKCGLCNGTVWNVGHVGGIPLLPPQGGNVSRLTPVITMSCTGCGNTVLINAIHLGVIHAETGEFIYPQPEVCHADPGEQVGTGEQVGMAPGVCTDPIPGALPPGIG